jgi:hypothetical protein
MEEEGKKRRNIKEREKERKERRNVKSFFAVCFRWAVSHHRLLMLDT